MKLQGIFAPIATPFDHEGNLYATKVRHNVEKWNRTTLAGYVVCGATGESAMLAAEEKAALWEVAAQAAAPEKILIAGVGVESVRETVCLARRAAAIGYKAVLARTPHEYRSLLSRPGAQELYYNAVADQSPIPLIIHNSPRTTGIDIAPEAVARLSGHPNIIGIKESSGNPERVRQLLREVREGFQVLAGSAATLWPSLQMGAAGAILAYANAAPYSTVAIWEAHRMREEEAGRDWQDRIAPAAELVTVKYGIPGLKYAMDLNGYYGGPPRAPLAPPSAEAKKEIESAFENLKG